MYTRGLPQKHLGNLPPASANGMLGMWVVAYTPAGGAASTLGLCIWRGLEASSKGRLVEQVLPMRTCRHSGGPPPAKRRQKCMAGMHSRLAMREHRDLQVLELCLNRS